MRKRRIRLEEGKRKLSSVERAKEKTKREYSELDIHEYLARLRNMNVKQLKWLIGSGIDGWRRYLAYYMLAKKLFPEIIEHEERIAKGQEIMR